MKYNVYHAKQMPMPFAKTPETFDTKDYTFIGVVEVGDMEDAFRATNHIESDWTKNPEVIQMNVPQARSTSVGDVLEDEDGTFHYCAGVGWEEIKRSA